MLITIDSAHLLTGRPLTSQQIDAEGNMWFFISADTAFLRDLASSPSVNASLADVDNSLYVSVSGGAAMLRDRQKIQALWNPMVKAWFPEGVDDPHLALLRVQIQLAEYWDSGSSKMKQLFEMAQAAMTGERTKQTPKSNDCG